MQNYPFKFLDSYQREDKDIFFGRKQEIDQLYEMVFKSKLIFLYGFSGTGKTSLIQCGLANKFKEYYWKPLNIRRGNHINLSLDKALCEASEGIFEHEAKKKIENLAQKIEAVYLSSFRPVYLVFDQLEELYILGEKEEQRQFAETIKEILAVEQPVKMLFSIREEYWGHLYEFEKVVPELLRSKLRVELMTDSLLKEVVSKTCEKREIELENIKDAEGKDLIDHILNSIRSKQTSLVSLPYLQVYLDKLYRKAQKTSEKIIFNEKLIAETGQIQDVLEDFLKEQIEETDKKFKKEDLCRKILNEFLSSEGTKRPCDWDYIQEKCKDLVQVNTLREILLHLSSVRIIKDEENHYELAHDSLAAAINNLRTAEEKAVADVYRLIKNQTEVKAEAREYFTEKQLNFVEPYLPKLVLSGQEKDWIAQSKQHLSDQKEKEKLQQEKELQEAKDRAEKEAGLRAEAEKSEKKSKRNARISIGVAVLAFGLAVFALWQRNEAEEAKKEAEKAKNEAVKNEKLALQEKENAEKAQKEAEEQTKIAEKALEDLKTQQGLTKQEELKKLQAEEAKEINEIFGRIDRLPQREKANGIQELEDLLRQNKYPNSSSRIQQKIKELKNKP